MPITGTLRTQKGAIHRHNQPLSAKSGQSQAMTYGRLFGLVGFYVAIAAAVIVVTAIALWFRITRHGLLIAFVAALLLKLWVIYESVRRRAIRTDGKLVEYDTAPGRFGLNVAAMIIVSASATVVVFLILYLKG